jgi:hypothetical protein
MEFLQDQAEASDHTAREWFYIMKTDFEYELKRKNPEATQ